ncbi:MAG: hypothetical protein KC680_04380, partial [Candidatus Peregrinibacteria bacterium]|nr:hypothetical protein [Candidatus Peregrinibacteria bacterium]
LDLEEKILNIGSLSALVCVAFPWVSGEWLGGKHVTYTGLGFFTSFIGIAIVLLHLYVLLVTLIPLTGGPAIVQEKNKDGLRLFTTLLASALTVAAWSVLTKVSFEFRLEISFGLYGTLIGSLVSSLYSFLLFQEKRKHTSPDIHTYTASVPPPAIEPEDHRF